MSDRDELAELIDQADDRWQHGVGSGGYDISGTVPLGIPIEALADAILASDWLAEHDRHVAAKALREAAEDSDQEGFRYEFYDSVRDIYASDWLNDRANQIEAGDDAT